MVEVSIQYMLVDGQKVETDCVTYISLADDGDCWHATDYQVFMI
jgi:hypothetical protein